MSLSFPAAVNTAKQAAAAVHNINMPTGIAAGDLICVCYRSGDNGRHLTVPAGWDGEQHGTGGGSQTTHGVVHKIADGTESGTVEFAINTGTSSVGAVAFRCAGFDAADPFNSDNFVFTEEAAAEDPWTVTAGLLTGVAGSDSNIVLVGGASASRTITTQDSGLTLIDSMTTGYSVHVLREESPGISNAAYSNNMSDSRAWVDILFEIKAAALGVGPVITLASFAA